MSLEEKRRIEHEETIRALEEQSSRVHDRMVRRVRREKTGYNDRRLDWYTLARLARKTLNTIRGVLFG